MHFCTTLRHTEPGIAECFVADLRVAVEDVKKNDAVVRRTVPTPADGRGLAPVYGLAGSFPVREAVAELLRRFVDKLYG